jgi:hypothetical protein
MKNIENEIKWYFKHKRSKKRALNILKIIESYKGKTNPKLIKLSNEYAKDVYGSNVYAPWLYVYSAFQNQFHEGWIPENYYIKEIVPRQKGDYGKIADRNFMTSILFSKTNIDILDLGYYINGMLCTPDRKILSSNNVKDFIFKNNNRVVYKLENSKQGKGVFVLEKKNYDNFLSFSNKYSNGVFQKFIQQHSFFSEFTSNSVATIRVTTTSDSIGNISVRAAYIRFGRDKHTHILSNSAISVPIDLNTGKLNSLGYNNWIEIDKHPDSNVIFKDKKIPFFENCLDKALQMHREIPFIGCIGWDIIVDKYEKVQLIEWNGNNNGIKFSEASSGPCFKGLNWESIWKEKKNNIIKEQYNA